MHIRMPIDVGIQTWDWIGGGGVGAVVGCVGLVRNAVIDQPLGFKHWLECIH